MPDKSNFTPDEWKLLLESVMMAGIDVSAAEPSGLWGLLKESFSNRTCRFPASGFPTSFIMRQRQRADDSQDGPRG
jgi:hypothetical protein